MPFDPDTSIEMANELSVVTPRPFTCQKLQVDPPPRPILLAPPHRLRTPLGCDAATWHVCEKIWTDEHGRGGVD